MSWIMLALLAVVLARLVMAGARLLARTAAAMVLLAVVLALA